MTRENLVKQQQAEMREVARMEALLRKARQPASAPESKPKYATPQIRWRMVYVAMVTALVLWMTSEVVVTAAKAVDSAGGWQFLLR
jgi:hypothetical protein